MCHLVEGYDAAANHNNVDGDPVPVPHFGLAMTLEAFEAGEEGGGEELAAPDCSDLRFEGKPGSRGCSS